MSGSLTSAYIDATGIHVPLYNDVLGYLTSQMQAVFGSDLVLSSDSQDGQMLAIFATAITDANSLATAAYNSFSPSTAQGAGLSQVVKINGIARAIPTNSTVDVICVGQAGTVITNGIVSDSQNSNRWLLPTTVTIPLSGQIQVTATAQNAGAITAGVGAVNTIATPTRGWQTVSNPGPAVVGAPLETDAALRQRQTVSTALPSQTVLDGTIGAVAAVPGVVRYAVYENVTGGPDANGIPGHSIAFVVDGGDATAIANAILLKKSTGAGTYGNVTETVNDVVYGFPYAVQFSRPSVVPITVNVQIKAFSGYTSVIGGQIVDAVVSYINSLAIGQSVYYTKLYTPANLTGSAGATFDILSISLSRDGNTPSQSNITIAFAEAASCISDNVTLTVS